MFRQLSTPLLAATLPSGAPLLSQTRQELAAASRFLNQATLGTEVRLIREIAQFTPQERLEQQFDASIDRHLPTVQQHFQWIGGFKDNADDALASLYESLVELSAEDKVTTFTTSDFGRDSDHGWGGNQIVLGRDVRGARLYGDFVELALWFGVSPSELEMAIPNVGRFYSPGSGAPLGFLSRAETSPHHSPRRARRPGYRLSSP